MPKNENESQNKPPLESLKESCKGGFRRNELIAIVGGSSPKSKLDQQLNLLLSKDIKHEN